MRISSCLAQPENFQLVFMLANYYETRKRGNSMKKALRITLNSIMSITIVGLGVATGFTVYHAQTEDQDANADTIAKRSENVASPASINLLPYFIGVICETFGASTLLTYLIISRFNKYSIKELMSHKK